MTSGYFVREYVSSDGREPFREWIEKLDPVTRQRIQVRLFRVELGNLGDHKSIGGGVREFRFNFGPGYRVYFTIFEHINVLLLHGGTKRTQSQDIMKAKKYLQEYLGLKAYGKKK